MGAMKLKPAFKDYLWGGNKLRENYGKHPDFDGPLAESWELSCHPDGSCIIGTGEYSGLTLDEYIRCEGKNVLGERGVSDSGDFPILIKFIDAAQALSVQVHPDEEYAQRVEGGHGKTEMWYVIDCDPGAELIYGFKRSVTRDEFRESILSNTLESLVNKISVHPGDVFFIEAGTIHAIGAGILIAEIQQNSNTTYRIYDYNRVDSQGNTRPLHIDKALDVTRREPPLRLPGAQGKKQSIEGCDTTLLAECNFFRTELIEMPANGQMTFFSDSRSFMCLMSIGGEGTLTDSDGTLSIGRGETVFIPADTGECKLHGQGKFILTGM